jgi:hypothetical protein
VGSSRKRARHGGQVKRSRAHAHAKWRGFPRYDALRRAETRATPSSQEGAGGVAQPWPSRSSRGPSRTSTSAPSATLTTARRR